MVQIYVVLQMLIPPPPGSITLSGATGSRQHRVNGIFEPTDEEQLGMPVYKKKGDADTWMEMVKGASGLRWYIKPTKEKGTSSVCYGYRSVAATNINLPQNCTEVGWTVYDGKAFKIQQDVISVLSSLDDPIPQRMLDMVEAQNAKPETDKTESETVTVISSETKSDTEKDIEATSHDLEETNTEKKVENISGTENDQTEVKDKEKC
mmetsp:Transcript_4392/g.8157  ORF Transcript_4392/g.8157 Transcript_4392/m.8157 type:complete len:207 (-) Transcript_4392:1731-2351(-)